MFSIFFVLLFALSPDLSVAQYNPTQTQLKACAELLRRGSFNLPDPVVTPLAWLQGALGASGDAGELDLDFSIRVGLPESQQIARGSSLRIQKKPGRKWFSTYGVHPSDLQGDPRYPIVLMGREVAAVLGFFMTDENTVIYPSVARINFGIEVLNTVLYPSDQIPVRFYDQDRGSSLGYLENLADLKIPISTDDVYLAVHDYVFHVPMILAAIPVLNRIQISTREIGLEMVRDFLLNDRGQEQEIRPTLESAFNGIIAYPTALLIGDPSIRAVTNNYITKDLAFIFGHGDVAAFLQKIFAQDRVSVGVHNFILSQAMKARNLSYRLNSIRGAGSGFGAQEVMRDLIGRRRVLRNAAFSIFNRHKLIVPDSDHSDEERWRR